MLTTTLNSLAHLWGHRAVRFGLQLTGTALLFVLLFRMAPIDSFWRTFQGVQWQWLLLSAGLLAAAIAVSVVRWQLLLAQASIPESYAILFRLTFLGLFCSLFLPTSAGGDIARVIEIKRRGHSGTLAFLATFQDRVVGLGFIVLVGSIATLAYFHRLPVAIAWTALCCQLGLFALSVILIYPQWLAKALSPLRSKGRFARWAERFPRLAQSWQSLCHLPTLRMQRLGGVCITSVAAVLLTIGAYAALGRSYGLSLSYAQLCLVVPLVILARMLPLSLNGIGVGESAFVVLAGWMGADAIPAAATAVAMLALQTLLGLSGGLEILARMASPARTSQTDAHPPAEEQPLQTAA